MLGLRYPLYKKGYQKAGGRIKRDLYENGFASVCFRRPLLRAIHIGAHSLWRACLLEH